MSYEKIVLTLALAIILSIYFYYQDVKETPEVIELESRLDYLIDKIKKLMSKTTDSQFLDRILTTLEKRDGKLENSIETLSENFNEFRTEMTGNVKELQTNVKQLQSDVSELKNNKRGKPPNEKQKLNFITITGKCLQISANWKLIKNVGAAILTATGAGGGWLLIEKIFLGG